MTEIQPIQDSTLTFNLSSPLNPVVMNTYWRVNQINWAVDFPNITPFDESSVFHCELNHTSSDYSTDIPWKIRIGKGGQMYSVTVSGTELMPPGNSGGFGVSIWNDDCMTSTQFSQLYHKTDEGIMGNAYIHGSGMYIGQGGMNHPFWCPLLSQKTDSSDRSISLINIGVSPNPSVHRADVLFYTKYRDIGAGAIEITFFYYNHGNIPYTSSESPWTAIRKSIFHDYIKGNSDGTHSPVADGTVGSSEWELRNPVYGGWTAKTAKYEDSKALTFGVVNGKDKHFNQQSTLTIGNPAKWEKTSNGRLLGFNTMMGTAPSTLRDFTLISTWFCEYLNPGQHVFTRNFIVLGEQENVIKVSQDLAPFVEAGRVDITKEKAGNLPLYEKIINSQTVITSNKPLPNSIPVGSSFSTPVSGSFPLFLMKNNTTGQYSISTDHYLFCGKLPFTNPLLPTHAKYAEYQNRHIYQIYDGNTEWIELLGFALPLDNSQLSNGYIKISDAFINVSFEAGEKLNSDQLMIMI